MNQNTCGNCSKPSTLRCSACHQVYYCSAECQRQDWKKHKKTHVISDCYKIAYPGDWDSKGVVDAFRNQGYLIIKLSKQGTHEIVDLTRVTS